MTQTLGWKNGGTLVPDYIVSPLMTAILINTTLIISNIPRNLTKKQTEVE